MTGREVGNFVTAAVERFLRTPAAAAAATAAFRSLLPPVQCTNVDAVLSRPESSYRDALFIQLAYSISSEPRIDLTKRPAGARTAAAALGEFLKSHHIRAVTDAYQNIGKNVVELARGNVPEFDAFLRWASTPSATPEQLRAAFEHSAATIAGTARPVRPMPDVDGAKLSFGATAQFLRGLLQTPSQGANEQFTIAALLDAVIGQAGIPGYRVETKRLNAADKSSRAAGDIQILAGNQIVEAYEVTANDWREKLPGAGRTIREHDLARLHVVARVAPDRHAEVLELLRRTSDDVSVLEIGGFVDVLVSALRRPGRKAALQRLYEFLDRYQPDVELVNRYADMLGASGLVRRPGEA